MGLADLPRLSAPTSGSLAEVHFRRLLNSCQQQLLVQQSHELRDNLQSSTSERQTSLQPVSNVKLRGYLDALHDQLSDLERSTNPQLPLAVLEAYRQHIRAIEAQLRPVQLPAFCLHLKGGPPGNKPRDAAIPGGQGGAALPRFFVPPPPPGGGVAALAGTSNVSSAIKDKLEQHEQIQDMLTSELADMAAGLKENTLGMQGAIRHRGQILETTETAMDDSVARAQNVAARSKTQVNRGTGSFCLTIMVMLVVCCGFAGMVVWIKFSSMLGLGYSTTRHVRRQEL